MGILFPDVGCCGAVCRTCPPFKTNACRGCKIGYDGGERDIRLAKCRIKICCLAKRLPTCGDCPDFLSCETVQGMYAKPGYKYGKYRQSMEFIRAHGYEAFLKKTAGWTRACGKL